MLQRKTKYWFNLGSCSDFNLGLCKIHVFEVVLLKKNKINCKMLQLDHSTPLKYTWRNLRMQ